MVILLICCSYPRNSIEPTYVSLLEDVCLRLRLALHHLATSDQQQLYEIQVHTQVEHRCDMYRETTCSILPKQTTSLLPDTIPPSRATTYDIGKVLDLVHDSRTNQQSDKKDTLEIVHASIELSLRHRSPGALQLG